MPSATSYGQRDLIENSTNSDFVRRGPENLNRLFGGLKVPRPQQRKATTLGPTVPEGAVNSNSTPRVPIDIGIVNSIRKAPGWRIARTLPPQGGWRWFVDRAGNVNLQSGPYVYQIGAGGGIYSLLGRRGQPLQAPTFKGEKHDRVVSQHVLWAVGTVARNIRGLNSDDRRWNQNQMGGWVGPGFRNPIYPTVAGAYLDSEDYILRVWSKTNEQFQPLLRNYFQSNVASLVRYTPMPNSVLLIERFVLLGRSSQEGRNLSGLQNLYMENWCTFRNREFTSVALELSSDGTPRQTRPVTGLPRYPQTPGRRASGYAVAYGRSEVVGVMYNRGRNDVWNSASYTRAQLFALLPASYFGGLWREGSIVVQSMAVAVAPTLREMATIVKEGQRMVPETRMIAPGARSVAGLSAEELDMLRMTLGRDGGWRTYNIGRVLDVR
jgi:hypothetical protein